jgi:uncharacterized membrane protein
MFSIRTDVVLRLQYSMEALTLEWRRQFATERRHRIMAFTAIATLSISFALFWLLFAGIWVILPFTAAELMCVAVAFLWIERAAEDRDWIEVSDDRVNVMRIRRKKAVQSTFTRNWLSTDLAINSLTGASGIRLQQSGRSIALVEFLSVSEQIRALRELRHALSLR